jgi:hypothetical protein
LARGFAGHFRNMDVLRFRPADATFLLGAWLAPVLLRMIVERTF